MYFTTAYAAVPLTSRPVCFYLAQHLLDQTANVSTTNCETNLFLIFVMSRFYVKVSKPFPSLARHDMFCNKCHLLDCTPIFIFWEHLTQSMLRSATYSFKVWVGGFLIWQNRKSSGVAGFPVLLNVLGRTAFGSPNSVYLSNPKNRHQTNRTI